jgi:hypothetical protein
VASVTLPAERRNAIYAQLRTSLLGIDDLRLAIEEGEFAAAERLARIFTGELRLILGGLGWGDEADESVELDISPAELRPILAEVRDRATEFYEAEREEQEAFRAPWERAALVRDTCDELLKRLGE